MLDPSSAWARSLTMAPLLSSLCSPDRPTGGSTGSTVLGGSLWSKIRQRCLCETSASEIETWLQNVEVRVAELLADANILSNYKQAPHYYT